RFLESTRSAAMITLKEDGTPHAVRVGVALVNGKLWSSGVQGRVRTTHLRRDPRCTLFVFDAGTKFLALESTVTILEGQDAPELNLRLFRTMQGRPDGNLMWFGGEKTPDEFLRSMREEQRVVYQFDVSRAYGMP
ncbi:MAG: pyridoxamine 5'-phosphate oxidase family protein, partial [Dehalococcoidia bacterium]